MLVAQTEYYLIVATPVFETGIHWSLITLEILVARTLYPGKYFAVIFIGLNLIFPFTRKVAYSRKNVEKEARVFVITA